MNTELLEALTILEEEKDISRDTLMDAIENSLINACKNHFGKADNIKVIMDKETCDYTLIQEKTVVEEVEDKVEQISLADAKMIDPSYEIGDIVQIPVAPAWLYLMPFSSRFVSISSSRAWSPEISTGSFPLALMLTCAFCAAGVSFWTQC